LVGAYFSIKRILEPIKLLTKGVDEISKGNLKHQISVTKKDELGELANSFNSMTKIINEMIRSKEQLLLDVSHELRSPLTRIKVAMEFLPDGKAKESISEDISEMEKMITEILETERLNSNYGKLNLEIYNISEIIKEVSEDFKDRQPGIKLIDIPKQVLLNIDVNRIKTVFNNILGNSLKYSKNQNQPIEISLSEQEKEIKIQIRDYGVGIPEKDLPFIFEPFYRVDRSRSKDTGGYGLGMSLCKKIMDAHGGKIEIKSSVNKGTTVELTFKK
jgi:signal transduction histidine kinase